MKLDQQRGDVAYLRICQLKESMAGVADRYEKALDRLEQAEEERSRLSRLLIEERIFTRKLAEMIRRRMRGLGKGE